MSFDKKNSIKIAFGVNKALILSSIFDGTDLELKGK